jgi:hypothetical protein
MKKVNFQRLDNSLILNHWGSMSERETASKMLESLGFTLKNERVHFAKSDTELFLAYADGNNVIIDITEQLAVIKRTITKQGLKFREVSQTSIADNISYLIPTESVVSNIQNLVREFKSSKNIRELSVVRNKSGIVEASLEFKNVLPKHAFSISKATGFALKGLLIRFWVDENSIQDINEDE